MDKELCYYLGHITKAHGSKGDLVAFFDVDDPHRYSSLPSVFVDLNGELTPFFIERIQPMKGKNFRISFEDLDVNATALLLKKDLYLPLDLLPEKTGKHFYYHEVIGFEVIDESHGSVGTIERVMEDPANPLLEIDNGAVKLLIPINDDVIQNLDREKKIIEIRAPEGLIDLYLGE